MSDVVDLAMRRKVENCLKTVALILESHRASAISPADQVGHKWGDKYDLSNYLTNTTIACIVNGLVYLGLTTEKLRQLKAWSANKAVSMKLVTEEKCRFLREIERDEEDPTRVQTGGVIGQLVGTVKVITKVKEYIYAVEESYQITAYSGVGTEAAESMVLLSRTFNTEVTTRSSTPPYKECTRQAQDVNISWLLKHLDASCQECGYRIDRSKESCFTPRQNEDTRTAMAFFDDLGFFLQAAAAWATKLHDFAVKHSTVPTPKLADFNAASVFNPVAPMFEDKPQQAGSGGGEDVVSPAGTGAAAGSEAVVSAAGGPSGGESTAVVLSATTVNALVAEQKRSLEARCVEVEAMCSGSAQTAFTAAEAKLQVAAAHIRELVAAHQAGVDFIEQMIRSQLVAAIGKEVSARDFSQYMAFHNRKVFREEFMPRPFSHAVRRSAAHSPEGQLQIETADTTPVEPIYTVSHNGMAAVGSGAEMEFALNATTTVRFGGERHLHGWMGHRFSGQGLPQLRLVAQARQFSSFIVLIGRIASAKVFQPKYAFIAQNKDEFNIPLELEQIPTAKEFRDAISSLSPEQQRFAKAYRSMQLESTLFAVCVVQIKPQLEKVLKLSADSLTKEIKLTQDLMQLFIKYQIPTDLLSYQEDGDNGQDVGRTADRLLAVKRHVQAMQEMLQSAKDEEVAEKKVQMRVFGNSRSGDEDYTSFAYSAPPPPPCPPPSGAAAPLAMAKGGGVMRSRASASRDSQSVGMSLAPSSAPTPKMAHSASSAPAPQPSVPQPAESKPEPSAQRGDATEATIASSTATISQVDYTKYPNLLEEMYTKYDPDSSLRPTIIHPGKTWTKSSQAGLLAKPTTSTVGAEEQNKEKEAAFELLDALTRSGALAIEHAALHVVIAATHCFDQSVMDTLVQKNVNPIERVERSTLIMAATLQGLPAAALVQESQLERLQTYSPMLLLENH